MFFVIIFLTASVGSTVFPLDFYRYAGQKGGTRVGGGFLPRTRVSQEDEEWKMKKRGVILLGNGKRGFLSLSLLSSASIGRP